MAELCWRICSLIHLTSKVFLRFVCLPVITLFNSFHAVDEGGYSPYSECKLNTYVLYHITLFQVWKSFCWLVWMKWKDEQTYVIHRVSKKWDRHVVPHSSRALWIKLGTINRKSILYSLSQKLLMQWSTSCSSCHGNQGT